MKSVVNVGYSKLPIEKKIGKSRFVVTSMTGNANFPTPSPTLTSVTTATNALETANLAAQGGGKDETALMHVREAALDLLMKSLGAYVEGIANATPASADAIILSAGMEVKGKGGATAVEFEVLATGNPGEVKLIHKGLSTGRGSYEFQMCTDTSSEANWQRIYSGTHSRFVKTGLVSGTRYFFRGTAINKDGMAAWSVVKAMYAL